jgi:RimJ/RimL family protein N-acetyltransferase
MTDDTNDQGQPIGAPVPNWTGCAPIPRTPMRGRTCDVIPLAPSHSAGLHAAFSADQTGTLWTYMPAGPFADEAAYAAWVDDACQSSDPLFFAIIDKSSGKPVGVASFLRIQPENGVAEVGYITFSPALQRTVMATEAMYLMMVRVFDDLGYRRYEWKCDALNAASRKAAARLGFSYDGLFKQALVYKGRNRDTAWFSILDKDWPRIKSCFENWIAPENFDDAGQQRHPLAVAPTNT